MDAVQEFIVTGFHFSEDIATLYGDRSQQQEVNEYRETQRILLTEYWQEMKKILQENIMSVLNELLNRFQRPNKLIDKRNDKLLDYDAALKRYEDNKDPKKQRDTKKNRVPSTIMKR